MIERAKQEEKREGNEIDFRKSDWQKFRFSINNATYTFKCTIYCISNHSRDAYNGAKEYNIIHPDVDQAKQSEAKYKVSS